MKGEYVSSLTYTCDMEFTKDIEFNNKPQTNTDLEIKYNGFLANSPDLYLVYGYNETWEHTSELKMQKSENQYLAKLNILDYNTLNFCFKNSYNQWDNNNGFNYISSICPSFDSEIISLFNELFSNENSIESTESKVEDSQLISENTYDLDQLIEELLQPLVNEPSIIEYQEPTVNESPVDLGEEIANILSNINDTTISSEVIDENYIELESETNDKLSYNKFTNDTSNEATLNLNLEKALSELFTNDYSEKTFSELSTNEHSENIFSEISTNEIIIPTKENSNELSLEKNTNEIELSTNDVSENNISDIKTNDSNILDEETVQKKIVEITKDLGNTNELDVSDGPVSSQFAISPRKLNKFYTFRKRIKLFFYKVFFKFPKTLFDAEDL